MAALRPFARSLTGSRINTRRVRSREASGEPKDVLIPLFLKRSSSCPLKNRKEFLKEAWKVPLQPFSLETVVRGKTSRTRSTRRSAFRRDASNFEPERLHMWPETAFFTDVRGSKLYCLDFITSEDHTVSRQHSTRQWANVCMYIHIGIWVYARIHSLSARGYVCIRMQRRFTRDSRVWRGNSV